MGNYTSFWMFENPRRGRQARNFTLKNVPKILDFKSSSEHADIFRKLTLVAPDWVNTCKRHAPMEISFF